MDVVGMEDNARSRGGGKQDDGLAYLIDGRELDTFVAHGVWTATQHIIYPYAAHKRIGGEVGLELAVRTAGSKVTHTHDLSIESTVGHRIEDETFGHELRVDVLVAKILTHVEALLGEDRV